MYGQSALDNNFLVHLIQFRYHLRFLKYHVRKGYFLKVGLKTHGRNMVATFSSFIDNFPMFWNPQREIQWMKQAPTTFSANLKS